MLAMFGMPGHFELMILGTVVLLPLALLVTAILVALKIHGKTPRSGNLFPCPDCDWMVSRSARACPGCGRPMSPA